MKRNTKIIQISGLRGLFMAIFIVSCLAAGFVAFPAIVAMKLWNIGAQYFSAPLINIYQGLLLWAMVAIVGFIINDRKKFVVALKSPNELSEKEVEQLLERVKIHSQSAMLNSMVVKSGEIKSVEKQEKQEEKTDKENV